MQIRLKTKLTVATAFLVLAVVASVSTVYVITLTRQVILQTYDRAEFVADQVFLQAQTALNDAAARGEGPVSSSPADLEAWVRRTIELSSGWNSAVKGALGYTKSIYEIIISDRSGKALISSDASLPSHIIYQRPDISTLVHSSFLHQLHVLYGPPVSYEVSLPFNLASQRFGDIRVAISTALLRDEISLPLEKAFGFALGAILISSLLAALLSTAALSPLERISTQLDRISAGETDFEPIARGDEYGQVSTKISRIGRELRDVREIFGALRDNLNQILTNLQDGLLLFNAEGRAVLASPSIGKFLGVESRQIIGQHVSAIFPEEHPIHKALVIHGEHIEPIEEVEIHLESAGGTRRAGLSAQAVSEDGTDMGTLLTLRDLESIDRIGSELQVSERLAAFGRVTAGVAHEVKNPLNSMRVWLEVLRSNLPSEPEPQQAVSMLNGEIERLDRVVKTFLDFSRPVELAWEDASLEEIIEDILLGARPAIERAGVTLETHIPHQFPLVRVDRQLIRQAILNLVLNACDAMPGGGHLTISLLQDAEMAEVRVADTGCGIAPENQRKIFQLFFTTRAGGTGMGLANSFRFVQLHNGSIEFESMTGQGTNFRIRLPLAHVAERTLLAGAHPGEGLTRRA
jgi:PAS domain S-box-containing protein